MKTNQATIKTALQYIKKKEQRYHDKKSVLFIMNKKLELLNLLDVIQLFGININTVLSKLSNYLQKNSVQNYLIVISALIKQQTTRQVLNENYNPLGNKKLI